MALAESRENYVYSAKLAEQAERYDGEDASFVSLFVCLGLVCSMCMTP